jgi:hypothetical protein
MVQIGTRSLSRSAETATHYRGAMDIRVEYEAGLAGEPEPAVVWFGRRRLPVRSIVDRWYGSAQRWWKLETDDGLYVLRRDDRSGEWELAAVPPVDAQQQGHSSPGTEHSKTKPH